MRGERVGAVVIDCSDPASLSAFWCSLLGLETVQRDDRWFDTEPLIPGGPKLAFQRVPENKHVKNRLHLDLHVDELAAAVARAEALGARRMGAVVHEPGEKFQVMADPEGNEFCLVHFDADHERSVDSAPRLA